MTLSVPPRRSSDLFAVTASRSTRRVSGKSSSMPYGNPYVSPAPDTTVVVGAGEDRVPGGITALLGSAGSGGVIALSPLWPQARSEEHPSDLQSLMRISYAVFGLKKKTLQTT